PQPVDRVYQDIGGRSQLAALYADCCRDPQAVGAVIVPRFADLGDSLVAVEGWIAKFRQLGISPCTVDGATAPADLQMALTIQQQQRQQRSQQGHAKSRIAGKPPPGKAPYGYRRSANQYLLDRSAAAVVRAFFDHFLLYGSLRQSVRYLAVTHGKTISPSTGKRWLSSPVYRGDLAYQNGDVVPDTHTAILTRDEAAQVDRLMRRNRQFAPRSRSAPRSLAGLVQCGRCHEPLVVSKTVRKRGRRRVQEYLYLRPRQCPSQGGDGSPGYCKALAYEAVLGAVIDRICEELPPSVGQAAPLPVAKLGDGIGQEVTAKQALIPQVQALQTQGILDEQTAALRIYGLKTEIAALQAQLGQLPPASLLSIAETLSIPQFWRDLSEAERRFYFREFIETVRLTQQAQGWRVELTYRFSVPLIDQPPPAPSA
ncbi:MAG: recombinase family protein, partial [Cyanobacteria bacterium P01_A01_bin.135]